ncbi:MAG: hypothetical protein LBR33_09170 [Propionibacteriaceae bacterium]|nr:hypothetical protein [Propionibacteriaceae bacterium]
MTWLAVLLAGLAVYWAVPPGAPALLRRVTVRPGPAVGRRRPGRGVLTAAALSAAGLGLLSAPAALVLAVVLVGATAAVLLGRRRRDARALARTREVARACRVLDALLAQGQVPVQALVQASVDCPLLAPAAAVARMGGDAAGTLRELAREPGAEGLDEVARAWAVTARTGAPLHGVLSRAKANLLSQAELAAVIAEELAAPRATGQLLAVLPLLGLGLAAVVGGHPIAFLTETLAGRVCLLAGVGLVCAGAVWSDVLAARAGRLSPHQAGRRGRRRRARADQAGRGAAEEAP